MKSKKIKKMAKLIHEEFRKYESESRPMKMSEEISNGDWSEYDPEVSEKFKKMILNLSNYKNNINVETKNLIVTTDGSDVEWYQGGEGYTDTVVKELIEAWVNDGTIVKTHRPSVSINELMVQDNYDWIHLDVEGIDGDLILCLEQRPNVIIYESMNLSQEMNEKLNEWFSINQYITITDNGNTIAKKY